jgi:excisionase family DNA binding protein
MQEQQARTSERVWLTYSEASTRTALDRSTLWRAVRRGDLRVGGVGRAPRFHVDDVDEFMRRGGSQRDQ